MSIEIDYRHDRRKHRHRCRFCWRILDTGDRVVGWKPYTAAGQRLRRFFFAHKECTRAVVDKTTGTTGAELIALQETP